MLQSFSSVVSCRVSCVVPALPSGWHACTSDLPSHDVGAPPERAARGKLPLGPGPPKAWASRLPIDRTLPEFHRGRPNTIPRVGTSSWERPEACNGADHLHCPEGGPEIAARTDKRCTWTPRCREVLEQPPRQPGMLCDYPADCQGTAPGPSGGGPRGPLGPPASWELACGGTGAAP